MTEFCRGIVNDHDDIIDFGNYVFSHAHRAIDFKQMKPLAYGDDRHLEHWHFLAKEDGKIKGMVGVFPGVFNIAENEVKTGYVGTVSTHPYSRGKGYMKALMKQAEDAMREDGMALALLGGLRQRYQYYGYEIGGIEYQYNCDNNNLRHYFPRRESIDVGIGQCLKCCLDLKKITDPTDIAIDTLYELYQKRIATGRTREDFYPTLLTWGSSLYAVYADNNCFGYINVSREKDHIFETELADMHLLPDVLQTFLRQENIQGLTIHVGPDEINKHEILDTFCQGVNLTMTSQMMILDHAAVLKALLDWKKSYADVSDGEFILGIEGDRNYFFEVKKGVTNVIATKLDADIIMKPMDAVRSLISPYYYQKILQKTGKALLHAPEGWFPLPYYLPKADAF